MKARLYKSIIFHALGTLVSVLPPALAVISYFPVWCTAGGEYVVSGVVLLLLLLSAMPLFNLIKRLLTSPAVWVMWLIAFIVFFSLSRIADEMVIISFVGFVSNVLGAILFKLGDRGDKNEKL